MTLKEPKTFDEQIDLLKSRGLIIGDEDKAKFILSNINYYRFSAYLIHFKKEDERMNKYIDFNQILQISDAKYKVYMSSDCYIINKKFIGDIIALAESNPFIGAVGIVGTVLKTFEHEEMVYGECLVNNLSDGMKIEKYHEIEDIYGEVDWLDEKFIITVQDIFWNEEKDHADIIHAMDMREAGYKNIVVRQEKQWVMIER